MLDIILVKGVMRLALSSLEWEESRLDKTLKQEWKKHPMRRRMPRINRLSARMRKLIAAINYLDTALDDLKEYGV